MILSTISITLFFYHANTLFLFLTIIFSTVIVGLLFQGVYIKRNIENNYPLIVIEFLTILSSMYFIILIFPNFSYLVLLSIPLSAYRLKRGIREKANYLRNPKIAFIMLALAFVVIWLGSAVIDYKIIGNFNFFSNFGFLTPNSPINIIIDFLSIFATVTSSPWFMINIGIWLGILGLFRLLELNKLENKIRFLLMMFAYAFYSIWLPSFSPIANEVQYVPYMWFNGLGTYGPVEPSYLLTGIIGTFVVTAIISFMFGSRQICSVTCTAPYMLQGTFLDSLKKFNRTSKIGRKSLTSRVNTWYKWIMLITWTSLIVFAILSYLNYEKILTFSIFGNDPTMFYASLYFNVLWYFQFMLMPFLGNYSCVNTGICAWGSFNQFFGYLGFFKLKVKDPQLCLKCKTVDCALACPVGLTDMRASFIKKGEFKSFRCIGVGDCVEACPHDNIQFYDVRSYIKGKIKSLSLK
ncbi:4Fe-4S binding protein [Saccharolobus sp. A20]|uniref:4Fe-4S binding protein n=1 Tax=Saccharolobus sp. A20 TaxID=1891280 RepID=UPI001E598055|nr:4Fe-4S binding protein [Sulfolobus sp. A20]